MPSPDQTEQQPYSQLRPEVVLQALESLEIPCDGRLLALNSYENRVYQLGVHEQDPVIAKFYRPGRWSDETILEEHSFAQELAAAEVPMVAPLEINAETLFEYNGYRFSISPRCGGRPAELDQEETLRWLGRFLGRMHNVGSAAAFDHRPQLTVQRYGWDSRNLLLQKQWIPMHLERAFDTLSTDLLKQIESLFAQCGDCRQLRLHGDFHVGNILWRDGPFFVDLDDCLTGPAIQDLWLLMSGDRHSMRRQCEVILKGYTMFCDFDLRELALIEPLRTLRMLHHAAWLARRWDDPAFPLAFPWFDSNRYWEELILGLREQAAQLQESPLSI